MGYFIPALRRYVFANTEQALLLTRKDPKPGHRDSAASSTRMENKGKEMTQQRDQRPQGAVHQGFLPYL